MALRGSGYITVERELLLFYPLKFDNMCTWQIQYDACEMLRIPHCLDNRLVDFFFNNSHFLLFKLQRTFSIMIWRLQWLADIRSLAIIHELLVRNLIGTWEKT
jgi:hypothetical protein